MAMLACKLLLIVIVAHESCIVNRQIGVEEWGHRRPPIYRSRDPAKFRTKNWLKKALTMAMLACKLLLIIVVAHESCIVNRQIGVEEWGHRRPPIYRSRDPAKFRTKNWLKKALTMAMLPLKLLLLRCSSTKPTTC